MHRSTSPWRLLSLTRVLMYVYICIIIIIIVNIIFSSYLSFFLIDHMLCHPIIHILRTYHPAPVKKKRSYGHSLCMCVAAMQIVRGSTRWFCWRRGHTIHGVDRTTISSARVQQLIIESNEVLCLYPQSKLIFFSPHICHTVSKLIKNANKSIHNPKTLPMKTDTSPGDSVNIQPNKITEVDGYIDHYIIQKNAIL